MAKISFMKTLYIHGLESFPVPEKIEIMQKLGLEDTALHLDYFLKPDSFEILKNEAKKNNVEFIIGSSYGGYLGYWLAEDLGLPCLLFNPAMAYKTELEMNIPEILNLKCPERYVVLGVNDDVVDPLANAKFMKNNDRKNIIQKVISCHWLGHQIDFDTFEMMVKWTVNTIKNN